MAPYAPRPGVSLYTPRAFLHTAKGTIEVHLDVVEAPLTVASFVALARRGFYDGLTFHRVEPGFVVQGGDPRGDGNGGPGYTLRCEITQRPYGRGAVGMALSGKDTGGSQFFVTLAPAAAPRRRLHALRQRRRRHGRRRPPPPRRRDRARRGLDGRVSVPVVRPRVRLVALDIDGTLLRSDKSLAPRTRAAIDAARARGVRVVLVTGRRYPSARRVAEDLGGDVPLILHNGALVVEGGRVLRCRPLAREAAARAIRAGRGAGGEPVVHGGRDGEGWLLVEAKVTATGLVAYYLERARDEVRRVSDLVAALEDEDPIQVMFGGTPGEMRAVQAALSASRSRAAHASSARSTRRPASCSSTSSTRASARPRPWRSCRGGGASPPKRRWRSGTTGTTARCWPRPGSAS